jgi:hypothetical protein
MDNLFGELYRGAKSSESGVVVAEENVEDIFERARLKSGTGVATSIKAGDLQDLSADMDEGRQEAESLVLGRQYWSCGVIGAAYRNLFYSPPEIPPLDDTAISVCPYCGNNFTNSPPDWDQRYRHFVHVHEFGACNQGGTKFFRADDFRQHLKHYHRATIGKWTNVLETACMGNGPLKRRRLVFKKEGSTHTIDKAFHEYNAFFADQGHYDAKSVSLKELKAPECKPKMFMCYTISQDMSGKNESNDRLMALRHRPTRFELRNADVQGLQFKGFKQPRGRGPITGATEIH